MSVLGIDGAGICILSFDSGGPGTYSQLLLLKECMSRLATDLNVMEDDVYPADYFDLIGGVGFGGLAAFALGHLQMNVEETIDALIKVAAAVFPEKPHVPFDTTINFYNLKEALEDMLQERDIRVDAKMYDNTRPSTKCKVALYAATSANLEHPQVFRTYPSRGSSFNPTIVEALCATITIPSHFISTKIGLRLRQQDFIGGPLGSNNPTKELLKEANAIFGKDTRVAQILSLGAGKPRVLSLQASATLEDVGQLMKGMMADCEIVARELARRLYNVDAYHRLNVEAGMEGIPIDNWTVLGSIESQTNAYTDTIAVTNALELSVKNLLERIGTATLEQLSHSSPLKVAARTLPALSPYYVLRRKEWEIMVKCLVTAPHPRLRIFPITGMGGSGKTQMVSYFLQKYRHLYAHTVFVDASSPTSIKSDLQAWVRSLGDGHERNTWEDAIQALSSVQQSHQVALIFDNADDPALDILSFLPKEMIGALIITSRNRNLGNLSTTCHLELAGMEENEAFAVLLRAARRRQPLAKDEMKNVHILMGELGYLAVALVQAGTYCHELSSTTHGTQPYTFTQYLSLFYSHRSELMKKTEPVSLDGYRRGVYTTLELSYEAIPRMTREFLHLVSFFHRVDIPLAALAIAADDGFLDSSTYLPRADGHKFVVSSLESLLCVEGKWSELQVLEMIRTLRSFSLLSVTGANDWMFLQLHPLVQSWSRDMVGSISCHYSAMVMQILTTCGNTGHFRLYRHLSPHIIDIMDRKKYRDLHVNDKMAAGFILRHQGHYRIAIQLFEDALETMWGAPEADHATTTVVAGWLSSTYVKEGRWSDAERLQLEVLYQRKIVLGPEDSDTIMAAANLAITYSAQGRWKESEQLETEVLQQRRRTMDVDDPDVILAAANLAATYHRLGRWDEAEKLHLSVVERRLKVFGADHPETITAAANLAVTYWAQGKVTEAEKLELVVLEKREDILEREHPDTILAAANLASTYHAQQRWEEAESLEVDVLEQRKRILGTDHPDTIMAAANLAATYHAQGRWSESENLGLLALDQRKRILGNEHPDTITAVAILAATYCAQDRLEEAFYLLAPAVEVALKVMGRQHPSSQDVIRDLLVVYEKLEKDEEAQQTRELLL